MFDVIIIGAGVTGLGASWHLTEFMRKKVLLLEQFPFPNQFGSSAGHSRITRELYTEVFYCRLMKETHEMWRYLEKKTGKELYIQNKLINFGKSDQLKLNRETVEKLDTDIKFITPSQCREMYPVLHIPEDCDVLLDGNAGTLRADKCIAALMERSTSFGLEFHESEEVLDIQQTNNNLMKVVTNKSEYQSKSVIVATGPWSHKLLKRINIELPFAPHKIHYAYYRPKHNSGVSYNYETFPSFMYNNTYGMCGAEFPGCVKIGDFNTEPINPDYRDKNEPYSGSKKRFAENVTQFLKKIIPSANLDPLQLHTCPITKTPDELPIIDKFPNLGNLVIGSGFNGSGFKTCVIHGKFLALLATNQQHNYDLSPFRIDRFKQKPKL